MFFGKKDDMSLCERLSFDGRTRLFQCRSFSPLQQAAAGWVKEEYCEGKQKTGGRTVRTQKKGAGKEKIRKQSDN